MTGTYIDCGDALEFFVTLAEAGCVQHERLLDARPRDVLRVRFAHDLLHCQLHDWRSRLRAGLALEARLLEELGRSVVVLAHDVDATALEGLSLLRGGGH